MLYLKICMPILKENEEFGAQIKIASLPYKFGHIGKMRFILTQYRGISNHL